MFRYAVLALLFVTGGCRLQFGQWQGAPPRASDQVRIALATNDERVRAAIEASWLRDPKIEIGYEVMPTITASNGISFRMPTEVSGDGWLEVRVDLAAPQLTCNGFSMCSATIKGSQTFDATLR